LEESLKMRLLLIGLAVLLLAAPAAAERKPHRCLAGDYESKARTVSAAAKSGKALTAKQRARATRKRARRLRRNRDRCYRWAATRFVTGKYTDARAAWLPLAESGHVRAQFGLYKVYATGLGVGRADAKKAYEWLRKAAGAGLPNAQYTMGDVLLRGKGVKQDQSAAIGWYQKAADQGHGEARFKLAALYYAGIGVPKNIPKGLALYRASADAGHPAALTTMGVFYFNGRVFKKSEVKARDWWIKASYAGEVNAMVFLARIYHNSTQLPRDYSEAYVWYTIAAERGDHAAKKGRTALLRIMRSIEVRRGKDRLALVRPKVR
jgi:TPR repeat protein